MRKEKPEILFIDNDGTKVWLRKIRSRMAGTEWIYMWIRSEGPQYVGGKYINE